MNRMSSESEPRIILNIQFTVLLQRLTVQLDTAEFYSQLLHTRKLVKVNNRHLT